MDGHDLLVIAEKFVGKILFYVLLAALVALLALLWRLVRRHLFPPGLIFPAKPAAAPLRNTSANPIVNEQLAQLDACRQTALALRARYAPAVAGPALQMDMTADAALRSIDQIVGQLDSASQALVKSQRPLEPQRLQALLGYGRQLAQLQRALG